MADFKDNKEDNAPLWIDDERIPAMLAFKVCNSISFFCYHVNMDNVVILRLGYVHAQCMSKKHWQQLLGHCANIIAFLLWCIMPKTVFFCQRGNTCKSNL